MTFKKKCTLYQIMVVFWFLRRIALRCAYVSQEHIASIFRMTIRSSSCDLTLPHGAEIQKIICSTTAVKS